MRGRCHQVHEAAGQPPAATLQRLAAIAEAVLRPWMMNTRMMNNSALLFVLVADRISRRLAGWRLAPGRGAVRQLARQAKETLVTMTTPGTHLKPSGELPPAAGTWRVDPAQSHATFVARVAGRPVQGRLPLTGQVLIAEQIEESVALLAARVSEVSTGSPALDRLLGGPSFLDAAAFPEISFRSELLAWVPAGRRAVGHLRIKGTEHELACRLGLHGDDTSAESGPRLHIISSWVIDSKWVTRQWIPGLGRRIPMTCSFLLEPRDANRPPEL
jgi:polyisoprenoid-binding protein YceI